MTIRPLGSRLIRRGRPSANTLDLGDPAFAQDPFPLYEELRRTGSVHFLPADRSWVVLGYDDVASVLSQPQVFSSSPLRIFDPLLLGAEPPEHTTLRRALAGELARKLPDIARDTEETATRLLESLAARAEFDAVRDFARPLTDGTLRSVFR